MTEQVARTPYCTKIRYGITGAPILDGDDMDGSHAPGVGVRPTLIELVYIPDRDGKPAHVDASVTGTWTRFGQPDPDGFGGQVATHFRNGPDGWPTWLAEEARLHDPDTVAERIRVDALKAAGVEYVDCPACGACRPVGGDCGTCAFQARIAAELEARGLR